MDGENICTEDTADESIFNGEILRALPIEHLEGAVGGVALEDQEPAIVYDPLEDFLVEKETTLMLLFPDKPMDWVRETLQQVVMRAEDMNKAELDALFETKITEMFLDPAASEIRVKKTLMVTSRLRHNEDPLYLQYCLAATKFYDLQAVSTSKKIVSIEHIENRTLNLRFTEKQEQFRAAGIPHQFIYAFHGTPVQNIDSILENGFMLNCVKRTKCGFGIYFSEQPEVSMGYSSDCQSLILCKVLLGQSGVNSKEVQPNAQQHCWAVVIGETNGQRDDTTMHQIFPAFVINYT